MTDHSAYSRAVIDSLPHSPWVTPKRQANPERKPMFKHPSKEAAKEAQKMRNRQFMALKRAATKINPQSDICQPFMPKSAKAGR